MQIKELATKYNLSKDDFWKLSRGGKDTWIVTHDACEKIMAIENISLDDIQVLNSENDLVRFIIKMSKDSKKIMSVGEADRNNCKSQYLGAMAEKRGIDRCVLKLIEAYQYGIYSDIESDSFKKQDDMATDKQLEVIRRSMDKHHVLIMEYIGKEFGKTMLPELTKVEASSVINLIKGEGK